MLKDAQHYNVQHVLKATGGGAHLYYDRLASRLPGVIVQKEDEMECLITGLSFFITEIPYEVFTYNELDADPIRFEEKTKDVYPYMVKCLIFCVSVWFIKTKFYLACKYWLRRQYSQSRWSRTKRFYSY